MSQRRAVRTVGVVMSAQDAAPRARLYLRVSKFDVLLVWAFDRLSREGIARR